MSIWTTANVYIENMDDVKDLVQTPYQGSNNHIKGSISINNYLSLNFDLSGIKFLIAQLTNLLNDMNKFGKSMENANEV